MHSILGIWAQWMAAADAAPRTVETRLRCVSALMSHAGVTTPLAITQPHVLAWLARPELAKWTRKTYFSSARALAVWLVERGYRKDDFTEGMRAPKTPRSIPRPIPVSTARDLLTSPNVTSVGRTYCALGLYQGLRVSEIARVRGEDVDVAAGTLRVLGKGGQYALMGLHPQIATMARFQPSGFWFPGACDGHVHPEAVSSTIRRALISVGSDATAHALRHTFASRVQEVVGDIRVTQQLMRHADVSSTQIYAAAADRKVQAALDGVEWSDAC